MQVRYRTVGITNGRFYRRTVVRFVSDVAADTGTTSLLERRRLPGTYGMTPRSDDAGEMLRLALPNVIDHSTVEALPLHSI